MDNNNILKHKKQEIKKSDLQRQVDSIPSDGYNGYNIGVKCLIYTKRRLSYELHKNHKRQYRQ